MTQIEARVAHSYKINSTPSLSQTDLLAKMMFLAFREVLWHLATTECKVPPRRLQYLQNQIAPIPIRPIGPMPRLHRVAPAVAGRAPLLMYIPYKYFIERGTFFEAGANITGSVSITMSVDRPATAPCCPC